MGERKEQRRRSAVHSAFGCRRSPQSVRPSSRMPARAVPVLAERLEVVERAPAILHQRRRGELTSTHADS
jgi:hypothetical protein